MKHSNGNQHKKYEMTKTDILVAWSMTLLLLLLSCIIMIGHNIEKTANAKPAISVTESYYSVDMSFEAIPVPSKKPKVPESFKINQFSKIAPFVIEELEGDDKIVKEPNGGIAKFGINSKANPNVDVRNLTRKEAYKIAYNKYYKPLKISSLPIETQLVIFDTAFNHGKGTAKKMAKQAKNCPETILKLRKAEYTRLVNANPKKYKKYHAGWTNRIKLVKAEIRS